MVLTPDKPDAFTSGTAFRSIKKKTKKKTLLDPELWKGKARVRSD